MTQVGVDKLCKRYGTMAAVDGIDLDVREGEMVVLLGPSGCGKTTTLRCIAGLEQISGGTIRFGDQVVASSSVFVPPEKRSIGMVFQSYAVWPHMTVYENIAFPLKLQRLGKETIRSRVENILDLVGLEKFSGRHIGEMSGGQQQRVAVARAIVAEPRLLLFDEPLSNLDAKLRESMRVDLRRLQQRLGTTALYVTHDQQEAMAIADRIVLMNEGRIEQIGSPKAIYNEPASKFAAEFIGLANIFRGTVGADGAGRLTISPAQGVAFELPSRATVNLGHVTEFIIRPEYVKVEPGKPRAEGELPARVLEASFLGSQLDLLVDLNGVKLRAQVTPPLDLSPGDEISVRVPPAKIILL